MKWFIPKQGVKKMNTTRILKKVKAFNSFYVDKPKEIELLKSVLNKQIKEDKKKKSKAAIKRIENNKEWIFVYDLLLAVNEVKSYRG